LALSSKLRAGLLGIATGSITRNTSPQYSPKRTGHNEGVTMNRIPDAEVLLTPKEVAQRFHVNPKTVTRWAKAGKLTAIRTLGGHRRYRESEVLERLREYKESSS
jgi:excisionase family DNA binding protein